MPSIKTRESVTGNMIKVLDKTSDLSEQMKNVYIRTKDSMEHGYYTDKKSPEEYASDKIEVTTEAVSREALYKFNEHGRKGFKAIKESITTSKENFEHGENLRAQSDSHQRAKEYAIKQAENRINNIYEQHNAESVGNAIKIRDSAIANGDIFKKGIKQTQNESARAAIKSGKRTVKTAEETAKTVNASKTTYRTAVKTSSTFIQGTRKTVHKIYSIGKAVFTASASAIKGTISATKALVFAIATGGWVAVVIIVIIMLIALLIGSSFGIFFSNENTGDKIMQDVVREINNEYLERIESIKADNPYDVLHISGSHADWTEILAFYAVKTSTDLENGQEVVTITDEKKDIIRDIFWQMNEISYHTEEVIENIISESDDGNGNVVETKTTETRVHLYIVVSHKTAAEMAEKFDFNDRQNEQIAALLDEENKSLWKNVLYGINTNGDMIVSVALSQIGNVGGEPYWFWYGFNSHVDWCACFVSWCANKCGYIGNGIFPKFASCSAGVNWFMLHGQWLEGSIEPSPGMIIFFDWDDDTNGQDGIPNHVGIVEKVENGVIYTIEGNSDDICRRRSYNVGYYEILGYGEPIY